MLQNVKFICFLKSKMFWYIIIIVILALLYTSLYFIFDNELTIYQTSLDHFDFSLLYKKQPIVIEDNVHDIQQIIDSWFNVNIVHYGVPIDNIWMRNHYKYLLISSQAPIEITISNPSNTPSIDSLMTTIKLKNNKILILPFRWYYHIDALDYSSMQIYGVHDYVTYGVDLTYMFSKTFQKNKHHAV